jgi:hypothetical protein
LRGDGSGVARGFAQNEKKQTLDEPSQVCPNDADLARIIEVWPTLPQHFKAAVMALVKTTVRV